MLNISLFVSYMVQNIESVRLYFEMNKEISLENHQISKAYLSGVSEIRTRDTLLAYTRFPGVPLQPLEHHSKVDIAVSVSSAPESEICCFNGYDFKSQREVNAFL